MASLNDQILDLRDELEIAKSEGKITDSGTKMLEQLNTKSFTTGGFGQFLQGLSLNFSENVTGALKSYLTPGPDEISKQLKLGAPDKPAPSPTDVAIQMERIGLSEYAKESPAKSISANIAGSAVPALVTKKPVTSFPAQMGLAGAAGFTAGLGESEAELFSPESLKSGGIGTATSLAVLPIAKGLGMGAGAVYRGVVKSIFSNPQRIGTDEARGLIKQALINDKGGVDEAIQFVLEQKGKPYSIADVGPNTRAYLDAANTIPGPGKKQAQEFLQNRDKGVLSRLTSDLQVAFGSKAAFFDEFNALKDARSDLGGKLYERALQQDVPVTPELTNLFNRPSVQDAYNRAINIAKEEGIKLPNVKIVDGKLQTLDGNDVTKINTTFLHYMKMGLDDVVFTGKSPTSGIGSTELGKIKGTRFSFLTN